MAIQTPDARYRRHRQPAEPLRISRGYWQSVGRRLRRDPVTLIAPCILILLIVAASCWRRGWSRRSYKTSMIRRHRSIAQEPWAPTNSAATCSRLIYGGRLSLFMGVTPVACALLIGGLLGIAAGFLGGRVNMAIMRTMDVFYAFPSVLLAISLSGAMGPGREERCWRTQPVFIPPICRVSRASPGCGFDFVDAAAERRQHARHRARACAGQRAGTDPGLRHVADQRRHHPAAGLSFLGLGVKPPSRNGA